MVEKLVERKEREVEAIKEARSESPSPPNNMVPDLVLFRKAGIKVNKIGN